MTVPGQRDEENPEPPPAQRAQEQVPEFASSESEGMMEPVGRVGTSGLTGTSPAESTPVLGAASRAAMPGGTSGLTTRSSKQGRMLVTSTSTPERLGENPHGSPLS